MDIIDFLLQRRSTPAIFLNEPGPNDEQLMTMLDVAVTAPDHGAIRPWRFLYIRGDARLKLGDAMSQAAATENPALDKAQLDKIRKKPLRSPLIVTVIATMQDHPKVPRREQMLSAGITAYNIELAACAMGFGAIWLTGLYTNHPCVTQALGLGDDDQVIGFIYLGTPDSKAEQAREKAIARPRAADISKEWA